VPLLGSGVGLITGTPGVVLSTVLATVLGIQDEVMREALRQKIYLETDCQQALALDMAPIHVRRRSAVYRSIAKGGK
jgi:hypothetical protein